MQLPLNSLAMDTAMMNPTMQIVTLMVGIAVVHVQLQIIVLIVCAIQDLQRTRIVSTKYNYTISPKFKYWGSGSGLCAFNF